MDGADFECLPCPANSFTKTAMSSSITSCVAKPGYSALENLQALSSQGDEDTGDIEDSKSDTFLEALELIKEVEKSYESVSTEDLQEITVFCKEDTQAIQHYDMPEFMTTHYASSLAECQEACVKNVYCTSFAFSKEDMYPTHTNSVMNYTGVYVYAYWPCQLFMAVERGKAVGCVVGRVEDELTWQRLRFIECPLNAYCPGDKAANIYECQDYSVTLSTGAYSGEHCLCVPGHELVGHVCEQCKLGSYKNTTENVACTECPQFFTTSITASTSAYECTCQAGMYMAPAGSDEELESDVSNAADESPIYSGELDPSALQTVATARSLRDFHKHRELAVASSGGVSMTEVLHLPWLEQEVREELEKVVELGVCMPCHQGMFCPGLWKDPPTNSTHMPPQICIEGSSVPLSTVNADSVEKCLCLAGYAYGRSSDTAVTSDSYFTCSKCPPATYKELQENSPCSGRCMRDAETYPGAVSKSQCFCQVGRYAIEAGDAEGSFSCVECVSGGVCTGGFKEDVIKAIEDNPEYTNISIADHTIPYPQKGWFAVFKHASNEAWQPGQLSASEETGETAAFSASAGELSTAPLSLVQQSTDRVPDIHPCPIDYRCHGGPDNECAEGGTGYLCSRCVRGYDIAHHGAVCTECEPMWFGFMYLFVVRLVVCLIVWIIAAVSCLAVRNPSCIHPILIRIWLSNVFLFFLFGFFPENSVSSLVEWAPIYRVVFAYPVFVFIRYPKVFCILEQLGMPLGFRESWYLQKFVQILVPVLDTCILALLCGVALLLFKLYKRSKIQRVQLVLNHARQVHAGDVWAMRTIENIQDTRCLGLFHYISPPDATTSQKIVRFFGDLVPAFMIIWFWSLPFLVIECTQLIGCVSTSYKDEPALTVLTALPEQECSLSEPWFLAGFVLGVLGILVWAVGSIIVFCVWMLYTDNADKLEARFRYGFLSNGYEFQYRAWEMLLMGRKLVCACLLTLQLHMSAAGTQEVFRNSVNLLIATMCLILQLLIEPYDRRSHNLTNRIEFLGLLTNVVNCMAIQGSYSFTIFKWLGPLPLITCGLFHTCVLWSLFVEAGRMVLMRPHLARLPSPWRYFNLMARSLARLYTRGNAKVYYNYITKEMVLEAAAKSRVFHIRRMIQRKKKLTDYRKINYENRTYFVSALTDSLSRLVISWCQFTIPGDWLDFTIRYSFCYCFWMRHRASSLREPLDLEEFDALRPSLFNECYVEMGEDDDGLLGLDTQCSAVEAEFLDMMVDDDVYDDSPITLMELYVAVQSMRYIPKGQLRRLHMWYRERMAAAASSDVPALRKENEELEVELQQLSDALCSRYAQSDVAPAFNVLDFFFTVEMMHEAEAENDRMRKDIEKEIQKILSARAARSVAERVYIELEKAEGQELEDVLRSIEAATQEEESPKDRTEYLEPALGKGQKKVKTRDKEADQTVKRHLLLPAAGRPSHMNLPRKRVLRPSFSGLEEDSGGKSRRSLSRAMLHKPQGSRTISPVGYGGTQENGGGDGSTRRRISVELDEISRDGNGVKRPVRRISLTAASSMTADTGRPRTVQTHSSFSSEDVGGSVAGKRTLKSSSLVATPSDSASSGEERASGATKRTARRPSLQQPHESTKEIAEGKTAESEATTTRRTLTVGRGTARQADSPEPSQPPSRRTLGIRRSGEAEPKDSRPEASPQEGSKPEPKRAIGLHKRPPGDKQDKTE
ncbi:cysteine repeat modular [Cyclospora cayetanensis]|uniref:Cysteine repeat modular n=1 Tax=Cyclospora cayetanensis TaxID=88456 RepID=A0A1D3D454_9EIME|nr:cysteine repeat modular [Cyclospora cayetanensis]